MARVANWNPQKGFGFVEVDGRRVFVHATAISGRTRRGQDLNGVELFEIKVDWNGPKGPAVTSAMLKDAFERQESERRESAQRRSEEQVVRAAAEAQKPLDAAYIADRIGKIREVCATALPVRKSWAADFEGVKITVWDVNVKQIVLDAEEGATVVASFSFTLQKGEAFSSISFPESKYKTGWDRVSRYGCDCRFDREIQKLLVGFAVWGRDEQTMVAYDPEFRLPRIESEYWVRDIAAQTPLGEVRVNVKICRSDGLWQLGRISEHRLAVRTSDGGLFELGDFPVADGEYMFHIVGGEGGLHAVDVRVPPQISKGSELQDYYQYTAFCRRCGGYTAHHKAWAGKTRLERAGVRADDGNGRMTYNDLTERKPAACLKCDCVDEQSQPEC